MIKLLVVMIKPADELLLSYLLVISYWLCNPKLAAPGRPKMRR